MTANAIMRVYQNPRLMEFLHKARHTLEHQSLGFVAGTYPLVCARYKIDRFVGLLVPATSPRNQTSLIRGTSRCRDQKCGPYDWSPKNVPATSPLVCADLKRAQARFLDELFLLRTKLYLIHEVDWSLSRCFLVFSEKSRLHCSTCTNRVPVPQSVQPHTSAVRVVGRNGNQKNTTIEQLENVLLVFHSITPTN